MKELVFLDIENNHIEKAAAFDRHFRQFGIEILPLENR